MPEQPYNRAVPIVKSDTVNIVDPAREQLPDAIYVGGAGIVEAVFQDGTVVPFTASAGDILPIKIKRVNNASTATLMEALFVV